VATAERFKKKTEAVGGRCELHLYKDASHGFFNKGDLHKKTHNETDAFLVSLGWLKKPTK
jgi:acetyl esterase